MTSQQVQSATSITGSLGLKGNVNLSLLVRGFHLRLSQEDAHVAYVECSLRRILDMSAEGDRLL